ncbi:peptide chain release factor N(5)-glutamine methyltransferase [Thermoanaerobacterium thermosaccharolyticum]|uniref:peptide chain release factor N(5)-glutamine methyltransferase n=1 Tax=Thermoanaerobacterium thermosaccharolyticum TaxID=1517 RepID=UPI00279EFDE3|nr:peptide chain release factor N(5)-glutamine methyltransferase [Thermoanaerobacterium thermosaccharolyticum]
MKIFDAVNFGTKYLKAHVSEPRLEAEGLLSFTLEVSKEYLLINRDKEITDDSFNKYMEFLDLRKSGMPYQYIVGKKHFMGLIFNVSPSVLIPRNDTEILVEEVLKRLKSGDTVLDIGTGSGAIAVSIAKYKDVKVYAVDISDEALEVAKGNACENGVSDKVIFIKSDLFSSIPKDIKFDLIVSNPPYIRSNEINELQEEVKREPKIALDGGEDGLTFYRKIVKDSVNYIKFGGIIAFEVGFDQGWDVKDILVDGGYSDIEVVKDLQGIDRVILGKRL